MRRRDPLVRSALVLVLGGLVVAGRRGLAVTAQEATPAALTAEEMVAALRAYARGADPRRRVAVPEHAGGARRLRPGPGTVGPRLVRARFVG